MDEVIKEFALKAEEGFQATLDFSDQGELARSSKKVLQELDKYGVGPRALSLLVCFSFDEKVRERMMEKINSVITDNSKR